MKLLTVSAVKDVMYHVTLRANLPSIEKKGLKPAKEPTGFSKLRARSKFGNYKVNSIYFSSSPGAAAQWVAMLSSDSADLDVEQAKKYCILKVDVSEWRSKFREDPDFENDSDVKCDAYYISGVTIPWSCVLKVGPVGAAIRTIKEQESYALWEIVKGQTPATLKKKLSTFSIGTLRRLRRDLDREAKRLVKVMEHSRIRDELEKLLKGTDLARAVLKSMGY